MSKQKQQASAGTRIYRPLCGTSGKGERGGEDTYVQKQSESKAWAETKVDLHQGFRFLPLKWSFVCI